MKHPGKTLGLNYKQNVMKEMKFDCMKVANMIYVNVSKIMQIYLNDTNHLSGNLWTIWKNYKNKVKDRFVESDGNICKILIKLSSESFQKTNAEVFGQFFDNVSII